jgi:hypothetical protein
LSLQSGAYEHKSFANSRDPGEKCGLGLSTDDLHYGTLAGVELAFDDIAVQFGGIFEFQAAEFFL